MSNEQSKTTPFANFPDLDTAAKQLAENIYGYRFDRGYLNEACRNALSPFYEAIDVLATDRDCLSKSLDVIVKKNHLFLAERESRQSTKLDRLLALREQLVPDFKSWSAHHALRTPCVETLLDFLIEEERRDAET